MHENFIIMKYNFILNIKQYAAKHIIYEYM